MVWSFEVYKSDTGKSISVFYVIVWNERAREGEHFDIRVHVIHKADDIHIEIIGEDSGKIPSGIIEDIKTYCEDLICQR